MKIPRTPVVFLCAAVGALAVAILKAMIVGGVKTLPPGRVLVFAACNFGVVAALIDWMFRDLFSGKALKRARATKSGQLREASASSVSVDALRSDPIVQSARL